MAKVILRGRQWYSDFRLKGYGRVRRPLSRDKRDAQIELGKLIERLRREASGKAPGDIPWKDLKDKVSHFNKDRKSPFSIKTDEAAIAALELAYPIHSASQVTPKLLEDFITRRLEQGKKPRTIRRQASAIKAFMRRAEKRKLVAPQDWHSVALPKIPRKQRPPFHAQSEMKVLIKACPGMLWKTVAWLGSGAGLRRGEMKALDKKDIDFDRKLVLIRIKADWHPKDLDERAIPLFPDLENYLRSIWPRLKGTKVLVDSNGRCPSLDTLTVMFSRITKKAGLEGSIQKLRHTFISQKLDDGINPRAVQEWAGHASLEQTMEYASPARDHKVYLSQARPLVLDE